MGENNKGALTEAVYYILLSVIKPNHGYGIMQNISELTDERLIISAGTLYGALNTLMERGWIKQLITTDDSRRKEYQITEDGKEVLNNELERLKELVDHGENVLNKFTLNFSIVIK